MGNTELKIGCDSGVIMITAKPINGIFFYELVTFENWPEVYSQKLIFISLKDAFERLKHKYQKWYRLYLIQISAQMIDVLKTDYLAAKDKDEFTKEGWLDQLTTDTLGF